jgi:hypothetical protein
MDYSKYFSLLDRPGASPAICGYCGSYLNLGTLGEGFCHFCEAHINRREEKAKNPEIEKFSAIQLLIDEGNLDYAKKNLDAVTAESNNPNLLFGAGSVYKTLSGLKYGDLDYNRKGFMEENSANIYSSLDLTSKSKEMFYKAIRLISDQTKTSPDDDLLYLSFISYIKLGRLLDAERTLSSMKTQKTSLMSEYANMVFCVESNKKEGYAYTLELMTKENPNGIYYLAKYLLSQKKLSEAKLTLERLSAKVRMPDAVFLLHKIDRLLDEISL